MGSGKLPAILAILVAAILLLGGIQADAKTKARLGANALPMNVVGGYLIVVKGSIGDRHDLHFLLDTGASTTAIDRKVADQLGLASRASQMVSFDKTLPVQWCVLPELAYGPERAANLKVVLQDLTYLRASGVVVDGVIGWDLLRRHSFQLDFAKNRIVFGGAISATEGNSVPVKESSLCLTVPVALGNREIWMVADTGMRGTMVYEPQLETIAYRWQSSISGRSVGGNVESQIVLVPGVRIGTQDLDRQVYVVRAPKSHLLDGIAGYLGIASLNAKQVTFDLDRGILSWR